MKILVLFLVCAGVFAELDIPGEELGSDDYNYRQVEEFHRVPEQTEQPAFGRPDGHEQPKKPVIGRPDGHERTEQPAFGRPDGHEQPRKPVIGRPDGHERTEQPAFGRPDGHEPSKQPIIGQPDGHDQPKQPVIGRPDGHESSKESIGKPDGHESNSDEEPLVRCKRPMCIFEMQCEHGMQTDASGCPVCRCLVDPCLDVNCNTGFKCRAVECANSRSCLKLTAECVPATRTCDGPEPMCSNYCPDGYELNSRGCMTCTCKDSLQPQTKQTDAPEKADSVVCGQSQECELGQICRSGAKAFDNTELAPFCAPKPLCHMAQEMAGMMRGSSSKMGQGAGLMMSPRMFVPDCLDDGTFNPLQCHHIRAECWCVDDRGTEIDGTRTTVFEEVNKPRCLVNSTVALHMSMSFVVLDDDEMSEISELDGVITDRVSSWLLVEKQYIKVLEAKTQEDSSEKTTVIVKLMVFHNSISDLPSAAEYMKRRMRMGYCNIPMEGKTLNMDPESLHIEHKFTYLTVMTPIPVDDGMFVEHKMWYECKDIRIFRTPLIILGMLLALTLMTILFLMIRRHRKQQYDIVQFKHRQLENQYSNATDKSFYLKDNLQNESVVLVTADVLDKSDKLPLA